MIKSSKTGIIGIVVAAAALTIVWGRSCNQEQKSDDPKTLRDISTHIPEGFVLVPIEVQNYEALDAILGDYGVVDLLSVPSNPNQLAETLAKNVRILRAPLDPKQFAVLAPQDQSPRLVRYNGPLFAVLNNPKRNGTEFLSKRKQSKKARTIYMDMADEDTKKREEDL